MLQLIISGVLLVPAALVLILTVPVVALLALPAAALLTFRKKKGDPATTKLGTYRRAIITGGSSGIGLAVAKECVEKGFDQVVIIARNVERLEKAKATLDALSSKSTSILAFSVDVSGLTDLEEAAKKIFKSNSDGSTYLFCCAGQACPYHFLDLTEEVIVKSVQTNQLGVTFTVKAMLPHMKVGTIVLCSSMAGQVGVFGLGAYSPTKFALVGLAQVLHMELVDRYVLLFL
jgi:3-dehydrosphinganine reductase